MLETVTIDKRKYDQMIRELSGPRLKPLILDGFTYGKGYAEEIKRDIIAIRDAKLENCCFESALQLSHGIAIISYYIDQVKDESEKSQTKS